MIVIHIESGLGNQMLSYCEYLAAHYMNPKSKIYIETIIYEIPECSEVICQWNGYEIEKIFDIKAKNIKEYFSDEQWERIIANIRKTEFWKNGWSYTDVILESFRKEGLVLENKRKTYDKFQGYISIGNLSIKQKIYQTRFGYDIRNLFFHFWGKYYLMRKNFKSELFISGDNYYAGQKLDFNKKNSGIEKIDNLIRETFCFPEIDKRNLDIYHKILSTESVAIHIRRGDMLSASARYYKYGYFKRAIKFIKKKIEKPFFFIFSDPDSNEWIKNNLKTIGITNGDFVKYVEGNEKENSFRDLQLMSLCKHQVLTNSSFGWWASYLNMYKDKITCSPEFLMNTTNWF